MMRRLSIRWKMTLWYGGVLAVVLAGFGTAVFLMMRRQLLEGIDGELAEELDDVLSEFRLATSLDGLKESLHRRFSEHEGFDFQITKADGAPFFYNPRLEGIAWPLPADDAGAPSIGTAALEGRGTWRTIRFKAATPNGALLVQVGRQLAPFEKELDKLLTTFLFAGPIMLLATVGGGYFLAGRMLQPVQVITKAARRISADRLNERVAVANPGDELGQLAATLNQMIERLERSFVDMQRFTADAAHELRTPLAIMRNEAEVALRQPRSGDEYRAVLENLLEETNHLSITANELLFLCRQDAGTAPPARETIVLDELLRDLVGEMQVVARDKSISLAISENASCRLLSDGRLLRRLFVNLLDNAVKYTDRSGQVDVSSRLIPPDVMVRVSDTGVGISPEHLPHVFDRFYRAAAARDSERPGAGLGLAICKSITRTLDGTIAVESSAGQGTVVIVTLPLHSTG